MTIAADMEKERKIELLQKGNNAISQMTIIYI
jgi:hypothetical protein